MHKKWILPSIVSASLLLTGMNTYFLYKHGEILNRTAISQTIEPVDKKDFQLFLSTRGVVTASDEKKIFIDSQRETVEQVLVKRGEAVEAGTPLVQFKHDEIDHQIGQLEKKLSQLQTQSQEIEQSIRDLEEYKQNVNEETSLSKEETDLLIEIRKLETEQRMVEMNMQNLEEEIDYLEKKKQKYVLKSNVAGIVEEVQLQGNHPFIDILVPPYFVEGEISEFHLEKVKEGQKVKIYPSIDRNNEYDGSIAAVSKLPSTQPTLHEKESFYPFYVELKDKSDRLPYGSHVHLAIILKESKNAPSIPKTAVVREKKKAFVYVVNNGKIEKRKVKLGISNGSDQEITSGLKPEEWIIAQPSSAMQEGMLVSTPLQVEKLQKETIKQLSKTEWAYSLLKGFLKN
jgi:HlyD family secretion protein